MQDGRVVGERQAVGEARGLPQRVVAQVRRVRTAGLALALGAAPRHRRVQGVAQLVVKGRHLGVVGVDLVG